MLSRVEGAHVERIKAEHRIHGSWQTARNSSAVWSDPYSPPPHVWRHGAFTFPGPIQFAEYICRRCDLHLYSFVNFPEEIGRFYSPGSAMRKGHLPHISRYRGDADEPACTAA